jgi:predicted phosphodiesterase
MEGNKAKIKVVVMSDTHDSHHKINIKELPPADIFIHAGDFTKVSTEGELSRFRQFLTLLPYKHKIVIAGNHDFNLDKIWHEKESKRAKQQSTPEEEIKKLK